MKVHIRDLATHEIVHSIDVPDYVVRTSNYQRFLSGLLFKTNTDRYYVDDSEADALLREPEGAAGAGGVTW